MVKLLSIFRNPNFLKIFFTRQRNSTSLKKQFKLLSLNLICIYLPYRNFLWISVGIFFNKIKSFLISAFLVSISPKTIWRR